MKCYKALNTYTYGCGVPKQDIMRKEHVEVEKYTWETCMHNTVKKVHDTSHMLHTAESLSRQC